MSGFSVYFPWMPTPGFGHSSEEWRGASLPKAIYRVNLKGCPKLGVYRTYAFPTRALWEPKRKRAKGVLFCLILCKLVVCPPNRSVYLSFLFQLIEQLKESREAVTPLCTLPFWTHLLSKTLVPWSSHCFHGGAQRPQSAWLLAQSWECLPTLFPDSSLSLHQNCLLFTSLNIPGGKKVEASLIRPLEDEAQS